MNRMQEITYFKKETQNNKLYREILQTFCDWGKACLKSY